MWGSPFNKHAVSTNCTNSTNCLRVANKHLKLSLMFQIYLIRFMDWKIFWKGLKNINSAVVHHIVLCNVYDYLASCKGGAGVCSPIVYVCVWNVWMCERVNVWTCERYFKVPQGFPPRKLQKGRNSAKAKNVKMVSYFSIR